MPVKTVNIFLGIIFTVSFNIKAEENLSPKQKDVLYRFAPIIIHSISKDSKRHSWDFPTSVDFDNDLFGNNNEESVRSNKFAVPATVYYAVLETESHYFLTYSLFPPLDWSSWPAYCLTPGMKTIWKVCKLLLRRNLLRKLFYWPRKPIQRQTFTRQKNLGLAPDLLNFLKCRLF